MNNSSSRSSSVGGTSATTRLCLQGLEPFILIVDSLCCTKVRLDALLEPSVGGSQRAEARLLSLCHGSFLKRVGKDLGVTGWGCCIDAGIDTVLARCGVDGGGDYCCGGKKEDQDGCE